MYTMGDRALTETANEDDLKHMGDSVSEALGAGALGLSTSRASTHVTPDGSPIASRIADWSDIDYLVDVMARHNRGIFQIGPDGRPKPYLKRRYLQNPTGIATTPGGLAVLSYSKGALFLIEQRRTPNDPVRLPAAQAQGLVAIRGGQFLASSAAAGGV